MIVYGDSQSGNCQKVRWLLDRLGRAYEWREVDITTGFTRSPEFLALNPAAQVPLVVLDDGRPLAQSNAILLYFAEGTPWLPTDAYDRARVYEWLFWEQYSHEPYVAVRRFQKLYLNKPDAEIDPKLLERGSAALDRMEQALTASPYLVGDRPTVADISLAAYTRLADEGGFELAQYPAIRAWLARLN